MKIFIQQSLYLMNWMLRIFMIQAVFATVLFANNGNAQYKSVKDIHVNLSFNDAELIESFSAVEQLTDLTFSYDHRVLDKNQKRLTYASKGATVEEFLLFLSKEYGLTFRQVNNVISTQKKKAPFTRDEVEVIIGEVTIKGRVTDENGEGLPGATITIKGSSQGTITDVEGNFTLSVEETSQVLVISFVGYVTQEVSIAGATEVNVSMEPDFQGLQEVVVIGYQTVQKKDLTGSTAIISPESSARVTANSLAESIQGLAPGITVRNGGAPGQSSVIEIRGVGSFADINPLYVIDGMLADANPTINTNDIESIQILKDASAAAIYGSRAANGVIIITTKQGKAGPMKVSFSGKKGVQQLPNRWDVMNSTEFAAMQTAQYENSGLTPPALVGTDFDPNVNTDWQDEIIRMGTLQDYNVSLSGGSGSGTYMISGSFFENEGVLKGRDFERYSFRVNSTSKIGRVTFGENLLLSHSITNTPDAGNPFYDMPQLLPVIPVQGEDYVSEGNPSGWGIGSVNAPSYAWNPVAILDLSQRNSQYSKLVGNAYINVKITDWISYKFNAGLEASFDYSKYLRKDGVWSFNAAVYPSSVADTRSTWFSKLFEHTLNINKEIGKHSLNAVVGISQQSSQREETFAQRSELQQFNGQYLNTINSATGDPTASGSRTLDNFILGYMGRINYVYDDRYLLTLTGRIDKNSRFAEDYRTGVFPSIAAGWRISEEGFFNVPFISNLKLTGSYGRLGVIPGQVGSWDYLGNLNSNPRAIFGPDQAANVGAYQARIANTQLKWETRISQNVGVEAGLLDDRILFTAEWYNSLSQDAILQIPLPQYLGNLGGNPFVNAGSIRNQGLEVSAAYRKREGAFKWDASVNFTTIKNKVEDVGNQGEGIDYIPTGLTRSKIGRPISEWYLLKTAGIFQSAQEVLDHTTADGTVIQPAAQPGDIRFVDVNGDGQITEDDRDYSGKSPWPTLQAGGQFNASYQNFTLNLQLIGVFGNTIYNGVRQVLDGYQNTNFRRDIQPWTEDNPNTSDPRIGVATDDVALSQNATNSTRWLEDGSYLRIRNLELGYNFSDHLFGESGIQNARLYLSGQNLLTFTKYSGLDPDVVGNGILERGFDAGNWPSSRVYSLGLQFQF